MRVCLLIIAFSLFLSACAGARKLEEGRMLFRAGNYTEAFQRLAPLAKKGEPSAQYALGYMYYYGKGTAVNKPLAKTWINAAAQQGDPDALMASRMIKREDDEAAAQALPLMLQSRVLE